MNGLPMKVARWQRMQELTDQARHGMTEVVSPVLKPFGFAGGRITDIQVGRDLVTVEYTTYFRNESFRTQLSLPREVWEAPDPVSAAENWAKTHTIPKPREY